MSKVKLDIELVPAGAWFDNLRSKLSKTKWDMVKRAVYKKAGDQCEICGGRGKKWPVECHEIWEHSLLLRETKMKGLIALCPSCHEVKHIGLALKRGRYEQAITHMAKVNGWSVDQADRHAARALMYWQKHMSDGKWTVDTSWLDENASELIVSASDAREALKNARRTTILEKLRDDSDEAKALRAERSSASNEAKGIVYGQWS